MVYLETLGKQEKYIISHIVEKWNQYISCDKINDTQDLNLDSLIKNICNNDDEFPFVDLFYQIDLVGGQIDIIQIYDSVLAQQKYGTNYKNKIDNIAKTRFYSLVISISFIQSLFKNNLIFFTEENLEPSTYDLWYVPSEEEYPRSNYIRKCNNIFYKELSKFLDKFLGSPIIPNHQLLDLYNNNFSTPEQTRFRHGQNLSKFGILTAILIALLSPWLMTKYSYSTIDQE